MAMKESELYTTEDLIEPFEVAETDDADDIYPGPGDDADGNKIDDDSNDNNRDNDGDGTIDEDVDQNRRQLIKRKSLYNSVIERNGRRRR